MEAESSPATRVLPVVVGRRAAKISMIGPIQVIIGVVGHGDEGNQRRRRDVDGSRAQKAVARRAGRRFDAGGVGVQRGAVEPHAVNGQAEGAG